jgi:hypothetical protein
MLWSCVNVKDGVGVCEGGCVMGAVCDREGVCEGGCVMGKGCVRVGV